MSLTPPTPLERRRTLAAAAACAAAFAVLSGLVLAGWTGDLDGLGRPLTAQASQEGLWPLLRAVEVGLSTVGLTVLGVALVVALVVRGAPREAAYVVCVLWSATAATTALKALVGRERPGWQVADHLHTSLSFPSGHATGTTALAVAVVVLARTGAGAWRARTTVVVTLPALTAVVLVAADRVLLGRHFPTDVVGGVLVGTALALTWAAVLGPCGGGRESSGSPVASNAAAPHARVSDRTHGTCSLP